MKNFRIKTVLLVSALFICGYGAGYFAVTGNVIPAALITSVSFALLYRLLRLTDRTNRELSKFLSAIKYDDFTVSFSGKGYGKSFTQLADNFEKLMQRFRKTRAEKEEQTRFLQTVLRHIDAGLICFDSEGEIEFINHAANRLLGINTPKNTEAFATLDPSFPSLLHKLKTGDKQLHKPGSGNENKNLILFASEFRMRDKNYKLVSMQNIQSELEEAEAEAWQKLIRVLTHEIMNSVTPISSLASTLNVMLEEKENGLSENDLADVTKAVSTIERRSSGLMHFIENYRSLTAIPKPEFEIVGLSGLLERIGTLLNKELIQNDIELVCKVDPESLEVTADPSMIEQILINLVKNSVRALEERTGKRIFIRVSMDEQGKVLIVVEDNGKGIPADIAEKIFIPFFTTSKDGSGIGLSLAKQIMRLHGGTIRAAAGMKEGARIVLKF